MSDYYKDKLKYLIEVLVMLIGISCFLTQAVQYFIGRWNLPFYKEVFMLVLFYIFSRYNSKVVDLFDAVVFRIRDFKLSKKNTNSNTFAAKRSIGGSGIDEKNL